MFVEKICTAFLLGLSWERILTCPFFVLGLSLSDRWTGVKFILGRLLGLVCLGTIVSIIGIPFSISEKWMNIIFSLFLFGVATYTLTNNKHKVEEYKSGKEKLFGYFVGQVMQATKGAANPGIVNDILKKKLAN